MARCDFASRTIFLNVRELANFQSPKYNNTIDFSPIQLNALRDGLKWHQIIQNEFQRENYRNNFQHSFTEIFISKLIGNFRGWDIIVRGRMDILQLDTKRETAKIIEIKTTSNYSEIDEVDLFWELQVKYYSYIFKNTSFG